MKTAYWEIKNKVMGYVVDSGHETYDKAAEDMSTLNRNYRHSAYVQETPVCFFDESGEVVGEGTKWIVFVKED